MIYSSWRPDQGGYLYYETAERQGLGDDLPVPRLTPTSAIGVASTEIGRPLPLGAKLVGSGPLARGSVVPLDRRGLSGTLGSAGSLPVALVAALSALGGFLTVKLLRRRRVA